MFQETKLYSPVFLQSSVNLFLNSPTSKRKYKQ